VSKNVKQGTGESLELFFQFPPDAQGFFEIRSESTNPLCVTINFSRRLDCSNALFRRFQFASQLIDKGISLLGFQRTPHRVLEPLAGRQDSTAKSLTRAR
jgi:hypothetical protein